MASVVRAWGWVVGLTIALGDFSPASCDEGLPIDGEPKLLLVIRDAQHANADRYPFGEIEVVAEMGSAGEPALRRVEAVVRWDGDKQRLTGIFLDRGDPARESGPRVSRSSFDLIYRDNRSAVYVPDQRLMTIVPISQGGQYLLTRLRPRDWWYGKVAGEGRTWADQIDLMLRLPPEILRHVHVRRLEGDRVEVSRSTGAVGSFRQVFSLRDDGNVLSDHMEDPTRGFVESSDYVWSRDSRDRCFLKKCRIERRSSRGKGLWWNYEVVRFDPDKRPPQSAFEERAIRVAPGTVIDDQTTGKRRRVGDRPVVDVSASLDRLVPELKSRGFAAPTREP